MQKMLGKITKKIYIYFIILFLLWISFFCEYVQSKYQYFVLGIFFVLFFYLFFQRNILSKWNNIVNISFLIFITSFYISYFTAVNRNNSYNAHYIVVTLLLLYFIFQSINFKDIKTKLSSLISILSIIVFAIGILELIFKKNFLYEAFFYNPFYKGYIKCGEVMSTQYHPAVFATFMLACLPFSLYCTENSKCRLQLLGILGSFASIVGIILSTIHFAFIGMIVLLSIYLFQKNRRVFKIFLIIFILFLAISILLSNFDMLFYKFSILSKLHLRSLIYRFQRVIISYKIWSDNLLTGVGFNNFRYLFDQYSQGIISDFTHKIPDNMYLSLLAETGILGLFSFIIFLIILIVNGAKKVKGIQYQDDKNFLNLMLLGLIALLINMNGYDFLYWHMPLYFFSIYIGIIRSYL